MTPAVAEVRQLESSRSAPARTDEATAAWAAALALLEESVTGARTFEIWIAPLELLGEARGALHLAAPPRLHVWLERHYGHLIGDAIRRTSDYRGAFLRVAPVAGGDGCL